MRIAAIDVGSNSVHMIVCRIKPDLSFDVIDREKDMIRLGAGVLEGGILPDAAMATAMQTLSKFRRIAESHGVDEIIASATSAVREADNGGDFLTAARRNVGLQVRVISGTEEARLIHLAAAYAVNVGRRASVVIDIGGGSTEITLGTAARVEMARSFKLGAIRLTERFGANDPLTTEDVARLVRHVRRESIAYLKQIAARGFQRVIGASGTILSLGALAAGRRRPVDDVRNLRVAAKDLRRLRDRLVRLPLAARLKIPGLDPRRADLAPVGILLLDTILDAIGAEEITLCDFALREGLVLDYIQRNRAHIRKAERYPDVRRRSVIELAERCSYTPPHASQVARLALSLFDGTAEIHGLGSLEREWLEFGALLHDIGHHISYEGHHQHSYYLIKHGDLRGFDPEETEIIALVARYHRRGTPKKSHEGFQLLPKKRREIVRLLAAIVRLAEGLDRSHTQIVSDLGIDLDDARLAIALKVRGDAELELWAANRHAAPLADLFKKPIEFSLSPRGPRRNAPAHAEHARHSPQLSRTPLRRRRHRRVGQDHAAGTARQVAQRQRSSRVRH
jgi:exopolyphosphatase/guanosine-5'-triphosphate,3'-diphosphate pyrophosphatase